MLERVPREQRRLVLLSIAALGLAIGFVVFALIFAAGRTAETPEEYEPFEAGPAARLSELIATEQPIFFPDPTGGDRGFFLTLVDGSLTTVHVVPPGKTRSCPIEWQLGDERFEDCDGTVWSPRELRRFPVAIRDGTVVVDLRERVPPRG